MQDKVPNLPNYENFMKAANKSTVFILTFMKFLMKLNRLKGSEIHYMDSTPGQVFYASLYISQSLFIMSYTFIFVEIIQVLCEKYLILFLSSYSVKKKVRDFNERKSDLDL